MQTTMTHRLHPVALLRLARLRFPVGLLTLGLVLLVWWLVDEFANVAVTSFPPIERVVSAFGGLISSGELLGAIGVSLKRLVIAFAIGASLGILVGLLMASSRAFASFMRPLLLFFQAIAGIAWIPLAIVWFGLGTPAVVFVVANAVFFLVVFNMLLGVQSIPNELIHATRSLGAGRLRVIREVLVPGALTQLLVGLETGAAFSWRALVAAELIVAGEGLGYLTSQAGTRFDSGTVVAGIISIGVLWLLIERLLMRPLRTHTVERWGMTRSVVD